MSDQKIGDVRGGKTRSTFHVYFDPATGNVYIKGSGFFAGKNRIRGQHAEDAQHAMRIAAAHVFEK